MADERGPRGDRPDRPPRPDRRRGSSDWKPRGPGGGAGGRSGGGPSNRQAYRGPGSDRPRRFEARPGGDADRPRRFEERPRDDRPQPRPFDNRPRDERPRDDRPRDDRPRRFEGPRDDRPQPRRFENRPPRFEDRPRDDRPRDDRPRDDGPRRFDRPRDERPRDDGPRRFDRPRDDRQRDFRGGRPTFGPRPGFGSRPDRGFDARRPPRAPTADTSELLGEGEELIAGKRPVEEAFAARRDAIRLLIVPERRAALDALAIHATTLRIPVVEVEGGSLTALAGFDGHQGVALVARPRQVADVAAILARARERGTPPFVLVLDSLEDPQNFGTLLRSAEACGVDGVIYPTRRAAPLSPAAIKASAGATEHLLLAPVDDLAATLADLHGDGLRIVGADEEASLSYAEADLRGPLVLVVGSEGRGISGPVRRRLDLALRIPMRGRIASLNAAVAGSVLLFAAAHQRPDQTVSKPATETAPKRAAKPQLSKPKPKSKAKAEAKPKTKPKAAAKPKVAAKPKRLTIRKVSAEDSEGLLPS